MTNYKSFVFVKTMSYGERIVGDHIGHISYPHHKKNCSYIGKIVVQIHVVKDVLFLHPEASAIGGSTDQFKEPTNQCQSL